MKSIPSLAALVACAAIACASSSSGGSDGGAGTCEAPRNACAPRTGCIGSICGLDALPNGACALGPSCGILIDPCPNWRAHAGSERLDAYACTCDDGAWSCSLCTQGMSLCAEQPDGAPSIPPIDSGAGG